MKFIYYTLLFLGLTSNEQSQISAAGQATEAPKPDTDLVKQWFKAVGEFRLSELQRLVGKIDVNIKNSEGLTALAIAIVKGDENLVKFLLSVDGINVDARNEIDEYTALLFAAELGYTNIAKLLLAAGADVNLKSKSGWTALEQAACKGNYSIVELLSKIQGIDVNSQDEHGSTALIWAAYKLLESDLRSISVHATNSKITYSWIMNYLIKTPGININIQNNDGYSALHWAVSRCYDERVQILLKKPDIKLNTRNKKNQTPLMIAIERANGESGWHKDQGQKISQMIKKKIEDLKLEASEAFKVRDLEKLKKIIAQIGSDVFLEGDTTLFDKIFAEKNIELIELLLKNSDDPHELLGRFPFEVLNPATDLFKYFVALGYGLHEPVVMPEPSKDKTPEERESSKLCASVSAKATSDEAVADLEQLSNAKFCAICSKECTYRCRTCKKIYYCSVECQKADWEHHKHDCQAS